MLSMLPSFLALSNYSTCVLVLSSLHTLTRHRQVIRLPMMLFPFVFSLCSDSIVALGRIGKFLMAEELQEPYTIDFERKNAVEVDGDFTWETAGRIHANAPKEDKKDGVHGRSDASAVMAADANAKSERKTKHRFFSHKDKGGDGHSPPVSAIEGDSCREVVDKAGEADEKPFQLMGLKLSIPKGSFVAIVGRVGCGKVNFPQLKTSETSPGR
jgi:ATP-binding cassette subfamily C (CFTR/MRP) protein 1